MKVRGSSADRALACNGSLVATTHPYNPNSEEGNLGSAKHAALAYLVHGNEPPVAEVAARFDVDVSEIERAVAFGRQAWAEIREYFPGAATEVALENDLLTGHLDVFSALFMGHDDIDGGLGGLPETMAVLDWKTGWSGDEHRWQLKSYADLARSRFGMPKSGYITVVEVHLPLREMSVENLTAEALDGFRAKLKEQVEHAGRQYAPGSHCKFCPRQHECLAREDYLRSTTMALEPMGAREIVRPSREMIARLWDRSRLLKRYLARYEAIVDEMLVDGPLDLGDGRQLALVTEEQDRLDAVKLESLLRAAHWTDDELSQVLTASKAGLERVVKSKVPPRKNGGACGAMRNILGALREDGGITRVEKTSKEVVEAKAIEAATAAEEE